ncbi:hypothetical protein X975_24847, partial [Stegodyphus mimosarum]
MCYMLYDIACYNNKHFKKLRLLLSTHTRAAPISMFPFQTTALNKAVKQFNIKMCCLR